ncbi:hypothetical protein ACR6C2_31665 [Streptomyces sp. INA 01156]
MRSHDIRTANGKARPARSAGLRRAPRSCRADGDPAPAGKKQAREPALIPGQIVNREIEELLREHE